MLGFSIIAIGSAAWPTTSIVARTTTCLDASRRLVHAVGGVETALLFERSRRAPKVRPPNRHLWSSPPWTLPHQNLPRLRALTNGTTASELGADRGKRPKCSWGNLKHLSLEQLGDVKATTASKQPEKVWRTPAAVYVITQEDIRRSGATSIPEILRLAPGVEVFRTDSDHWAVGVRGFGGQFSKSLLVLIDGRSVYTPLFAGVYWQVQDTLLEDIERIEVIRGPGGTIWGANAVNGVINIITKNARDTYGSLASVSGGNVDQGIAGARYGAEGPKELSYRIYGKGFIRGPEFHPDRANFDDGEWANWAFEAIGN